MLVSIYQPEKACHTFDEVRETLLYGIAAAGIQSNKSIILNAHLVPWDLKPSDQRILYNFEQRESPALNNSTLHVYRQHEVWDYSESNVAWLKEQGIKAKHVPLGYVPELRRIKKVEPDIDVLFYGLVNNRRRKILDDLRTSGLTVCELSNYYSQERDQFIARSKVVLNMHYYETGIFEIVRCSYLFANEICVVSEQSIDVPPELERKLSVSHYSQLVGACQELAHNSEARNIWAATAHNAFRSCDEAAILQRAIWTGS